MAKPRPPQPMEAKRLLRPQTKIDLIIDVDYLNGLADIRPSMIIDNTGREIIVAQTSPPIMKSKIGQSLEASVVHHSIIEASRWGWRADILGLDNNYKLHPEEPNSETVQIIRLSPPLPKAGLTKSNVRQAYRLDANQRFGITLDIKPAPAPFILLNFSAGGFMLITSKPSAYSLGQELSFELNFPPEAPLPLHKLKGRAAIVRLELDDNNKNKARLGLRFLDLGLEARRALPKILNHYMLEEQRIRNRDAL